MKKLSTLYVLIMSIVFFNSCTMEKRTYMKGYHVEWNKSKKSLTTDEVSITSNSPFKANNKVAINPEVITIPSNEKQRSNELTNDNDLLASASINVGNAIQKQNQKKVQDIRDGKKSSNNYLAKKVIEKEITKTKKIKKKRIDGPTVILFFLCFLIPPLAVYLHEGEWTSRCTVNLLLSLLCFFPGIIHALYLIITER
jgi:uncharacterized membrane protein YqaE (UPF0057 family)